MEKKEVTPKHREIIHKFFVHKEFNCPSVRLVESVLDEMKDDEESLKGLEELINYGYLLRKESSNKNEYFFITKEGAVLIKMLIKQDNPNEFKKS